jgi:hypothetical protein
MNNERFFEVISSLLSHNILQQPSPVLSLQNLLLIFKVVYSAGLDSKP